MKVNTFGSMPQRSEATTIVAEPIKAVNEVQFFDFNKQKCQRLTLGQLSRTNRENRGDDNTPMHGIYHFALIQRLIDMCAEHGYNANVYDLFATNNRDKQTPGVSLYPELEAKYGQRAV